jgi:hypothetical protein
MPLRAGLTTCARCDARSEIENRAESSVDRGDLIVRQVGDHAAEPLGLDGDGLFSQHICRLAVDLDLGPETGRPSAGQDGPPERSGGQVAWVSQRDLYASARCSIAVTVTTR